MDIDVTPVEEVQPELAPNADFKFVDYEVKDDEIIVHFVCSNPGAAMPSDYYINLTDEEVANLTDVVDQASMDALVAQFETLSIEKLQRKYRAENIAHKLEPIKDLEVKA